MSASRTQGKRVRHVTEKSWRFPYCSRCLGHVRLWNSRYSGFWLAHGVALAVAITGWISGIGGDVLWPVFVGGNALALVLGLLFWNTRQKRAIEVCSPECRCPGLSVAYLGWSGSVQTFEIVSEDYAADFMRSNEAKLVNVDADTIAALHTFTAPSPSRGKGPARAKRARGGRAQPDRSATAAPLRSEEEVQAEAKREDERARAIAARERRLWVVLVVVVIATIGAGAYAYMRSQQHAREHGAHP